MFLNCCQVLAPSTYAASKGSFGKLLIPARTIKNTKGVHCQVFTKIMETNPIFAFALLTRNGPMSGISCIHASGSFVNQLIPEPPSFLSNTFKTPVSLFIIDFHNIAMTIGQVMTGMMRKLDTRFRPMKCRWNKTASPRPKTNCVKSANTVYSNVLISVGQNNLSFVKK
ncbi:hypothetical protein SDC9_166498 [bioreactor metagenome]|uniref:Uncharacterized protein n=1 Tax=bioreactor metagenome TaxID=1076179 RepID=A0A645FZK6_9ZZZZ